MISPLGSLRLCPLSVCIAEGRDMEREVRAWWGSFKALQCCPQSDGLGCCGGQGKALEAAPPLWAASRSVLSASVLHSLRK